MVQPLRYGWLRAKKGLWEDSSTGTHVVSALSRGTGIYKLLVNVISRKKKVNAEREWEAMSQA